MRNLRPYIAGLAAFVITLLIAHGRWTPYNNYVLLADAFAHGHAWIAWPGPYIDALGYGSRHYVIEAPLPAILLTPFVALWGYAVNQTTLAIVLCGVSIGAAWELCERYGVSVRATVWLCAFMLAGTDLLWCAMLGDVWFIAHVGAVCFTLLALVELAGKRRGWLVALWAACALESRFTLALALPFYAYLLATDPERPFALSVAWRARAIGFASVLIPVAALWVWYNFARWGLPYDIGYTTWYHQDAAGSPVGSPFQLRYVPYELWSFFWQGPARTGSFPWIAPTFSGLALTWASPALILAFRARKPRRLTIVLALLTLATFLPNLAYYVNGFAQFGMRHALDFEPFAFALMALGARKGLPWWACTLIGYSVGVGLWGCWYWNVIVRHGN